MDKVSLASLDNKVLIDLYRQMLLIRKFEEKVKEKYMEGKIFGMLHLYIGEEAVAVGVCSALRKNDYITSNHRGHGHFIAKGGDVKLMMAELYGKSTGYCKGRGGSMHIADIDHYHLGATGIVGEGLPLAAGAALACVLRESNQVVVSFFGDGALNTGEFHESLNLASLWKLPVVYICENNFYAISTHLKKACSITNVNKRAESYNMPGVTVDGMDVLTVRNEAEKAINRAREGNGPSFLVCNTYRFLGHGRNPDTTLYRTREEEAKWKKRCPVENFKKKLLSDAIISISDLDKMGNDIKQQIGEAIEFAEKSPYPEIEDIEADIYA